MQGEQWRWKAGGWCQSFAESTLRNKETVNYGHIKVLPGRHALIMPLTPGQWLGDVFRTGSTLNCPLIGVEKHMAGLVEA